MVSSQLAQFLSNKLGVDVLDDGNAANLLNLFNLGLNATPTGSLTPYAGTTAPAGYFICDGSAKSRTTYAALFAVIGTAYGAGDGSTTFNIPNTQGVFLRGAGSQTIAGKTFAATLGTASADATAKNGLALNDPGHSHSLQPKDVTAQNGESGHIANGGVTTYYNMNTGVSGTGITLSGGDAETRPANLAVNYLIKN